MKDPDIFSLRDRLRRARILRVPADDLQILPPREQAVVMLAGFLMVILLLLAVLGLAVLYAYNKTWGTIAVLVLSCAVIATAIFVYIKDLYK